MKWTCSLPFSVAGVISHVPPHAAVATFPAVSVPPKGSVNTLVTPPRMQKLVFSGAYTSVEKTLPAPYAASCAAESACAGPARNVVDAMSSTATHSPRLFRMVVPPPRSSVRRNVAGVLKTFQTQTSPQGHGSAFIGAVTTCGWKSAGACRRKRRRDHSPLTPAAPVQDRGDRADELVDVQRLLEVRRPAADFRRRKVVRVCRHRDDRQRATSLARLLAKPSEK